MKIFKQLALAAALAAIGISAHAGAADETLVIDQTTNLANEPGSVEQYYDFGSLVTADSGAIVQKGDSFTDVFFFNVQDPQDVTLSGIATPDSHVKGAPGVTFSSIALFDSTGTQYALSSDSYASGTSFLGELSLTGGAYVLQLTGTIAAKYGQFSGTLDMVPTASAVPEPASVALMIAGLGLMGAVVRRRNDKA